MKQYLIAAAALALSGCITTGPINVDKAPCSTLIPSSLRDDVEGADIGAVPAKPDAERNTEPYTKWLEDLGNMWRGFGVAQTGQLKKVNEEKKAVIEGQQLCEKRDAEAVRRAKPKILGVF